MNWCFGKKKITSGNDSVTQHKDSGCIHIHICPCSSRKTACDKKRMSKFTV